MQTRRNRNKRKSRKGGEYGMRMFKTWADNYRNCMNQTKDEMADEKCTNTMRTTDYRSNGTAESWTNHKRLERENMWKKNEKGEFEIKNPRYKKNKYEYGFVDEPDRKDFIQQFETRSMATHMGNAAMDFGRMIIPKDSYSSRTNQGAVPIANPKQDAYYARLKARQNAQYDRLPSY